MHLFVLLPELGPFVRDEWRAHFADDFRRLQGIPSASIYSACGAFLADREAYDLEFATRIAAGTLPPDAVKAFWKRADAIRRGAIWLNGYSLAKLELRTWLKQSRSPEERAYVEAQLKQLANMDTPKAPEIRRALKPLLSAELGTKLASGGGGVWTAPVQGGAVPLALEFDFGGFGGGLRWDVLLPINYPHSFPVRVSYESALGFASKDWDLLRSDWLEAQLRYLVLHARTVLGWLTTVNWAAARSRVATG